MSYSDTTVTGKGTRPLPVNEAGIPRTLKRIKKWVVWEARWKPNGKVDKVPVPLGSGRGFSWNKKRHQLSFSEALAAHRKGLGHGVGIVLDGQPIETTPDGRSLYLVAVDLDNIEANARHAKRAYKALKGAYVETSPSGNGLHIFALCDTPLKGGNAGEGREMYSRGRFMTVTGHEAQDDIIDASEALKELHEEWLNSAKPNNNVVSGFDFSKGRPNLSPEVHGELMRSAESTVARHNDWPEDGRHIAKLCKALACIPANDYETWRTVIWAVASLRWSCGEMLLIKWSKRSAEHWATEEVASQAAEQLGNIYRSYNPKRGLTVGTLLHLAKQDVGTLPEGWEPDEGQPEVLTAGNSFRILTRNNLDALPDPEWLVSHVLPTRGLAAIYGAPGSGKTFLAMDQVLCVSQGKPRWFGRRVEQRPVLYVALEGVGGMKHRVKAWEKKNDQVANDASFAIGQFDLRREADINDLIAGARELSKTEWVVVVDTLAQSVPGLDENASADMGLAISAAQRISSELDGLVILVHHSGKDASKGLRGHSSLNAAVDVSIEVKKHGTVRKWSVKKSKDGPDDIEHDFDLKVCNVGHDRYGLQQTSCVVKQKDGLFAGKSLELPTGKHQRKVLTALTAEYEVGETIAQAEVMATAKDSLERVVGNQHRATRAKDAVKGLVQGGYLVEDEGGYSLK